jgi:PBP1b-binding outer membrane lipoprotein LpoB
MIKTKKSIFVLIAIVSLVFASCGNKKTDVVGIENDTIKVETPVLTPEDSTTQVK